MTIKHYIHDAATGETVEIELTAQEIAERELAEKARLEEFETSEARKAEAKAALLERLGITADEAALLLG